MKKVFLILVLLFIGNASAFEIKIVKELGPTANASWPASSLPLPFFLDSKASDNVPLGPASNAIQKAFSAWQNIPGQTMRFTPLSSKTGAVANSTDRNNHIVWVEKDWPFSSVVLAITKTSFLIQNPPNFVDTDILFNGVNFQWSASPTPVKGKADIQTVALHEIGHAIGLQHSQVKNARMLPSATSGRILSTDEQSGVRFLYSPAPSGSFQILTPGANSIVLGGPNPLSLGFPFVTYRWTAPIGFSNFVVEFSSNSSFSPASKVKKFSRDTQTFLEETQAIRSQLKTLAGTAKRIFWRVQAVGPAGKQTTAVSSFSFQ